MRTFLLFFFVFNLLISSFYLDIWKNANTTSRVLPIVSWFEEGTFKIDKYHELTCDKALVNGHYYTDKAPLPTYVIIPFFGILKFLGIIQADTDGNLYGSHVYILGAFITASLPLALLIFFLFRQIRKRTNGISPVLLATLPFYASFIFVFAGTYFAHIFSAILLLLSYSALKRNNYLLAGFWGGLSFLSEYNLAVILFLWGVFILIRERQLRPFLKYSLGILPSLLFLIYYNSIFSSSPWVFLYKHHNFSELDANYGFVLPGLEALWGLSFSTYRGIFFFSPFLLLLLYEFIRKAYRGKLKSIFQSYLFVPFLGYYIFIASYFAWWGGWTYGPRLLLAMVLILIYEGVLYFSKKQLNVYLFYPLIIIGLLISFSAKITIAYSAPTGVFNPFYELAIKGIQNGNFNPNNLLTMLFNIPPGISAIVFISLFCSGLIILTIWFKKWQEN